MKANFSVPNKEFQLMWDEIKFYHIVKDKYSFIPWDVVVFKEFKRGKMTGRQLNVNVLHSSYLKDMTVFGFKIYQRLEKPDRKSKV